MFEYVQCNQQPIKDKNQRQDGPLYQCTYIRRAFYFQVCHMWFNDIATSPSKWNDIKNIKTHLTDNAIHTNYIM